MTLPDERYRAVLDARALLYDLADSRRMPEVSPELRHRVTHILRHFPTPTEMDLAAKQCPNLFQLEIEAVWRLMLSYKEGRDPND